MGKKKYSGTVRFLMLFIVFCILAPICHGQDPASGKQPVRINSALYSFPLKAPVSGTRVLVDQNNRPFFWLGDAAWSLIAQLKREDVDYYLENRKDKGFSVILVSLIEHKFAGNAPSNYYGEPPFIGKLFTTPNEKYFENADYVIESAARKNILVLLAPLYLGYDCKDEGWCSEVKSASADDLYTWGKFLGRRYSKFGNIIWIIGGDTDPSPVKNKILEMIRGLREYDMVHLFSAHNQPESMAVTPWKGESFLNINNVYSYDSVLYKHFKEAYDIEPAMPFYLCESAYENEHNSTPQELRAQAYQTILSGSMGHIFGNCPVWHFGSFRSWCNLTDWKSELDNAGSAGMNHFQNLFRSRSWNSLTPDFTHTSIISGYGRWGFRDYVCAARTNDGTSIIAYIPSGRSIRADLSKIDGRQARCWWYEPSTGKATLIGIFQTAGSQSFTTPSESDWVLIIDNDDAHLAQPGLIVN